MKPTFIGIGGHRCATTWLYDIIMEHPHTFAASSKELHFFSYYYHFGYKWYENQFIKPNKYNLSDIIGEYSTSYLYDTQAPERVKKYNPQMKIIASLRNPVERAMSHHKHELQLGRIKSGKNSFNVGIMNNPSYLDYGYYYKYLKNWLSFFKKDRIFIILYDDICHNPVEVKNNLYNFLKLDQSFKPVNLNTKINTSFMPKNYQIFYLQSGLAKGIRRIGFGFILDVLKKKGIKQAVDGMTSDNDTGSKVIDYQTRITLINKFRKDVNELSILLGRDLSRMWFNEYKN